MVGPMDIMSIPGNFSPMIPHSNPAWIASTVGSSPYISLKIFFERASRFDFRLGFQLGFGVYSLIFAPESVAIARILSRKSCRADIMELLELKPINALFSSKETVARFVDVSTRSGML